MTGAMDSVTSSTADAAAVDDLLSEMQGAAGRAEHVQTSSFS